MAKRSHTQKTLQRVIGGAQLLSGIVYSVYGGAYGGRGGGGYLIGQGINNLAGSESGSAATAGGPGQSKAFLRDTYGSLAAAGGQKLAEPKSKDTVAADPYSALLKQAMTRDSANFTPVVDDGANFSPAYDPYGSPNFQAYSTQSYFQPETPATDTAAPGWGRRMYTGIRSLILGDDYA